MITSEILDAIRESVGVRGSARGTCPFCDKKHFQVNENGSCRCWSGSCSKTYSLYEVGQKLKIDVSAGLGITIEQFLEYFNLPEQAVEIFKIEEKIKNKKPYIMYPILDQDGNHYTNKYRYAFTKDEGQKFASDKAKDLPPYNVSRWNKKGELGIIVEGETDTMALVTSCLLDNVLGVLGTGSFNKHKYGHLIKDITNLLVWSEKDVASNKMLRQISLLRPDARVLVHPKYKDPAEFLKMESREKLREWVEEQKISAPKITEYIKTESEQKRKEILKDEAVRKTIDSGDLFESLRAEIKKVYAGDNNQVLAGYISMSSRGMEHPLSIFYLAPSSAGKSYTCDTAFAFIPDEEKIEVIGATAGSFVHREDSYQDKVLYINEYDSLPKENDSPIASTMRALMSGKEFHYETSTDTKNGKKHISINKGGNISLQVTGTRNPTKQYKTRMMIQEIKHGKDDLKKIGRFTASKYLDVKREEPDYDTWKKISSLVTLTPDKITIPFMNDLVELLPESFYLNPRINRDMTFLGVAIQIVAKIYASLEDKIPDVIEADIERDYGLVRKVFGSSFTLSASDVSPERRKIYNLIKKSEEVGITSSELQKKTDTSKSAISPHLKALEEFHQVIQRWKPEVGTQRSKVIDELPEDTLLPTVEKLLNKFRGSGHNQGTISTYITPEEEEPAIYPMMTDEQATRQLEHFNKRYPKTH